MGIYSDDNTVPDGLELKQFYDLVYKAAEMTGATPIHSFSFVNTISLSNTYTGRGFALTDKLKPLIEEAGFIRTHHEVAKLPLGPWAADKRQKEVGAYIALASQTGYEAFGLQLFTGVLGMSVDEAKDFLEKCKKQAADRKIHSYSKQ